MKDEIDIPVQKEEDFVAANIRRDNYSRVRDKQAMEFNAAISSRLLAEKQCTIKCEKCGKEFTADISAKDTMTCPDCR
jgi:hypothetical protein